MYLITCHLAWWWSHPMLTGSGLHHWLLTNNAVRFFNIIWQTPLSKATYKLQIYMPMTLQQVDRRRKLCTNIEYLMLKHMLN